MVVCFFLLSVFCSRRITSSAIFHFSLILLSLSSFLGFLFHFSFFNIRWRSFLRRWAGSWPTCLPTRRPSPPRRAGAPRSSSSSLWSLWTSIVNRNPAKQKKCLKRGQSYTIHTVRFYRCLMISEETVIVFFYCGHTHADDEIILHLDITSPRSLEANPSMNGNWFSAHWPQIGRQ